MPEFKAAAVQMRSGTSIDANLAEAERLVREAAAAGASYILTPEMTNILCRDRETLLAAVSPEAGNPEIARFSALARALGVHLHVGSMAVRLGPESVANRAYLFAPDGTVVARYDKIHMFDVNLPNGESYRESALYRPGTEAVVADLPFARLGLAVCYDVRFPQLFQALANDGASVLAVPAAFTRTTGEAHWHVLLRARAIETGSFVVAAAQGGHHEDGRDTFGHSMIVDPWGRILAEAGTEPGIVVATIDPAQSADARARIPALANRRDFAPPGAVPALA
ncbi:MAG: carbon-nitrogen hydrolase family protein [Rhizobiales bacterium]|nr:carbon-nitrogen hydrolase family protein [Hyphomicrobiales bacterium]